MQPVSGPGAPLPGERSVTSSTSSSVAGTASSDHGDQPLTPAQRTTLENLVLKVAALTTSKATEIWNNVKQGLGLTENAELQSRHYQPAEQLLQNRLTQAQDSGGRQQLLQQLTDMLSQGNNRQTVSDFIRQQFGHTVLGSLSKAQLQQVVTLLQNGRLTQSSTTASPSSQTIVNTIERPLNPAEQNSLNQLVNRVASQMQEQPAKIWSTLMSMQNLKAGEAIPLKNLPFLTQFIQAQSTLQLVHHTQQMASPLPAAPQPQPGQAGIADSSQPGQPATANSNAATQANASLLTSQPNPQTAATFAASSLSVLQNALQQPLTAQEQQMLLDYTQNRFHLGLQTPLTPMQMNDILTLLFAQRIQRAQENGWATFASHPQPLLNPLIASLPLNWQSLFQKPLFLVIVSVCVVTFLLWVLL
ncbi:flagella biosynthesis regulator Flk [Pectobacterium sp. B1J-3]|uniref:flagella biosynthesis regulator Flk n=1 Tax=Pectobacterium sp. B1J-3 TaxID=3385371 RepID=UPI003905E117